jgi:thymidylate kinase
MTSRRLLLLVGETGSGKSTVVSSLVNGWTPQQRYQPVAHVEWLQNDNCRLVTLERYDQKRQFAGTDSLALNAHPSYVAALCIDNWAYRPVLGEGNRLATLKFLQVARSHDWDAILAFLHTPPDVCEQRRSQRDHPFKPSFVKNTRTRADNLFMAWDGEKLMLDGNQKPELLAAQVAERLGVQNG